MKVLKKAAGFVLGAVGAVIGFVVAGPVGAAIGFSVGMGIGSAVQMAAMKTKVPDVSSATQQRLNVSIDPDANRKIAFGETALGTDQVYWETWGPESSYYDQVIAAAGHEIESFGKLYFDDEEVTFSGNSATGAYAGALTKADRTVGVSGTALTVGAGTKWTSACSLTGVAHYALRIQWSQEKFPRGIPSRVTRVGKGAKVYDPRRDSTRGGSGSHRADDQSTWEYSPLDSNGQPIGRNPALQILWYEIGWRVTNPSTSEKILTCGRGRPLDDIDFASFITAANDCEEQGYYSDVLLSTGDAHATNIAVLEAACAGKVMDTGGLISLRIRTDTTGDIVQAFTDADIIDTEAGVWRPSLPLSERWNQGRGSFVDPRALYRITPLPEPVRDATYEAEDGWKRPGPEFRFDAVQDPEQAQKLIRLELNISRYMGVFTAPFNWRAKKVKIWDIVTLTSASDGFGGKLFRVLEKKTDPMGAIWLLLREDDPSIYSGGTVNPVPAPSIGAGYDARVVTAPDAGDWTITPAYIEGGGAKIPSLLVSGAAPAANIVATHAYFRIGLGGNWIYQGRYTTGQTVRLDRTALAPGQTYYVQLVYENAYGVLSSPTVFGPYTSPSDYVVLSSLLSDGFVGQGALATADQVTWATQVTGVGKPEDYATVSRVFRQSSAPSSPNTNDIWVQLSGTTPIAVRAWSGSAWITGADITLFNTASAITGQGALATLSQATWATQVTGVGKPEDYATQSRVFRQATAPSSPNTNDIWVQTSGGSPIAVRAWNGSSWVTGADITLINTAAAIAGQGWGATASEAAASNKQPMRTGGNLYPDPGFADGTNAVLPLGVGYGGLGSGTQFGVNTEQEYAAGDRWLEILPTTGPSTYGVNGPRFEVRPGEKLSVRCALEFSSSSASVTGDVRITWRTKAGTLIRQDTIGTASSFNPVYVSGSFVAPANAAQANLAFVRSGSGTGSIKFYDPEVLRAEPGADVTGNNTASAIAGQGVFATGNYYEQASDPSSAPNGSFLFRTDTNELKIRRSGSWAKVADIKPATTPPWTSTIGATGSGTAPPGNTANVTLTCSNSNNVGSVSFLWSLETNFSGVRGNNNGRSSSITYSKVIGANDNIITTGTLRVIDAGTGETRFLPFSINWKDINNP